MLQKGRTGVTFIRIGLGRYKGRDFYCTEATSGRARREKLLVENKGIIF